MRQGGIISSSGHHAAASVPWVADFKNGVYTVNGVSVAVTDMFRADPASAGPYDPATDITPGVGLLSSSFTAPILTGVAMEGAKTGATYIINMTPNSGDASFLAELTDLPNYAGQDRYIQLDPGALPASLRTVGSVEYTGTDTLINTPFKVAVTVSPSKIAASFNGGSVTEITGIPTDVPVNALIFTTRGIIERIESVAQVANSALPALST